MRIEYEHNDSLIAKLYNWKYHVYLLKRNMYYSFYIVCILQKAKNNNHYKIIIEKRGYWLCRGSLLEN